MRLLTSDEMKLVEQSATKFGLSYKIMMENAGTACARNIRSKIETETTFIPKSIVIVCGKGNNGGDGFVIARKLRESGYNVSVVLSSGYPVSQEATYMYKLILDQGIKTVWYDGDKDSALSLIKNADVIVDAVFGFSFYGVLDVEMKELFNVMSNAKGIKFAVDVPSGVYCDSGYCDEDCFKADYTVAISALKPAHIIEPAADCCGDIIIANIGIPEESYKVIENSLYTYSKSEIRLLFPERKTNSHKGTFGHLLCICGSKTMAGAPVLAASAALRSGAGLVTLAFPESLYNTVSAKLTEALLMPLQENENGTISAECLSKLVAKLPEYDAVLIGCGLGVNEDTKAVVRAVIENSESPVILDADALNIISKDLSVLESAKADIIVTPHIGEMERLTKLDKEAILNDKVNVAQNFSHKYNVTVVLKSANTVVAFADSNRAYINNTGNTGLSKGGSGDVLAGLIGGFAVQNFTLKDAVTSAVYLHGFTADTVADRTSMSGMLPSDVVSELAYTLAYFEK